MVEYTQEAESINTTLLEQVIPKTVLNITGKADGTNLILQDHARIFRLYNKQFLKTGRSHDAVDQWDQKIQIWNTISRELSAHLAVEEIILYPLVAKYLPDIDVRNSLIRDSREEHDTVKRDLERMRHISTQLEQMILRERDNETSGDRDNLMNEFESLGDKIMRELREHIDKEESELIPAIRQHWSDQQLRLLYAALSDARSIAPHVPYPDPGWHSGPQTSSLELLTESFIHPI